ncbi:MAG: DegT/DnrJ/EryC1/StrS family aminotransferase [Desulfurococcales archaeon]|nr:DegT/DnrJ/EryC1/StrS family aminotransferase [Desulfurococcales archaeon]
MKHRIPVANIDIGIEEERILVEVIRSGWISSQSPYVRRFEEEFSKWINVKHSIAVSNGTVALHLALLALGVGPGDEVIVPDITFASPANMVILTGARPVFVDVTPEYWCIDPNDLKRKITERTKAIIVVHLYGHPADMDEILEIAKMQNIYIIEDAAEAHGAEYKGKKVGTYGDVATFSFYANKVITTGEGGMVITNIDELADKIRLMRDHGMRPRYWHVTLGFNYRMTGLQAAIGIAQIRKIDKLIERKRTISMIYNNILGDILGIDLPPSMPWARPSYWLYSILVNEKCKFSRNKLMKELEKKGIETRKFFYPLHSMPIFRKYSGGENYPISTYISMHGINLPSGPKISDEDVEYVAKAIKKLCGES